MPAHSRPAFPVRQRGSMTVAIVFAVIVGLVLLGVAQLGYAYYMKREIQKASDLAALSAVQVLGLGAPADCARAQQAGRTAVLANVPAILDTFSADDVTVECKVWDSTRADASGMYVFDPAAGQTPNALRITVNKTLSSLLPDIVVDGAPVRVVSVAVSTRPVAVFTVGSRLVRLQKGGLLSQLLATVGATPAQLDILDAAGLASVNITPSGLLEALGLPVSVATGVGTPAQLAALNNLTLGQLLQATLTVMNKAGDTAGASLGLLTNAINVVLNVMPVNLPVKLFGDGGVLDLNVVSGDINSALQANINALNVLETALVIANGQNLVNLGLNVPLLGVQAQARIVEPPSIGVGGVGAQATSAGIRVYLRANTSNIPLVGPLLANTLGTRIDLPIIIDVAQSTGTVSKLCQAPLTESQATIDVTSSVANICLGRFPGMASDTDDLKNNFLSLTNSCQPSSFAAIQPYRVLNVLNLLPLTSKVTLPIFNSTAPVSVTLTEPPSPNSTATVTATSVNLGGAGLEPGRRRGRRHPGRPDRYWHAAHAGAAHGAGHHSGGRRWQQCRQIHLAGGQRYAVVLDRAQPAGPAHVHRRPDRLAGRDVAGGRQPAQFLAVCTAGRPELRADLHAGRPAPMPHQRRFHAGAERQQPGGRRAVDRGDVAAAAAGHAVEPVAAAVGPAWPERRPNRCIAAVGGLRQAPSGVLMMKPMISAQPRPARGSP